MSLLFFIRMSKCVRYRQNTKISFQVFQMVGCALNRETFSPEVIKIHRHTTTVPTIAAAITFSLTRAKPA